MKKIALMLFVFVGFAFGADGEQVRSFSIMAAAIGLGIAAFGGAIAMGNTAAATITGTARNPGIGGKLLTTMFIALAMIEAQVIYALVVGLIILYANPLLG